MLETVKLVAQSRNAPREPRLQDTRSPTDSCRKHWEIAPFLARLVAMKRWKSLSWPTFPPVMAMGNITGWWEPSKGKGKPIPPFCSYRWVASHAGSGGGAPLWRGCEASSEPLCGRSCHILQRHPQEMGSCLVNPLPYWISVPWAQHPYPNHRNMWPVWNSKRRTGRKWRDCLEYHPPCD